jgi:hypothetical protein
LPWNLLRHFGVNFLAEKFGNLSSTVIRCDPLVLDSRCFKLGFCNFWCSIA